MKNTGCTNKLKLTIGAQIVTGTINDTEAGRAFASLLPITLTLSDYGRTEKASDLPHRLDLKSSTSGYKPSTGDITYYTSWINLAIFYEDFTYSPELVLIGRIDGNLSALLNERPFAAKFELTD
ncbi:cyclophilin-like fold protein [Mucilaginibacter lappiensis]|uniref:Cyclophilin-like domain-containing protein n=1 Tax=Mucilaginibacter lappiensis TaxID=354630 RepID=A0A841JK27_9SPHI|nr:cyclophilin-like fold protein [Mucilaginibacter lappiensis]MBB6130834.1 hypothetical protein [Mucilaginibacter lappiensis]